MDQTKSTSSDTMFALTGKVDGRQRLFLLQSGGNSIGRSSENDVVLTSTGVSGRHAVFEVGAEGFEVRDLASKNGTFLAGKRVASGRVEIGQLVQFGPVTLCVEQIEREDTWLSVAAEDVAKGAERGSPQTSTFVWSGEINTTVAQQWLRLLDAVTSELGAGENGARGRALATLSRGLGASCAALLELPSEGSPLVVASYGDLAGELPLARIAELKAGALQDGELRVEGLSAGEDCWIVVVGLGEPALILEGEFAAEGIARPLLRILHRMLSHGDMNPAAKRSSGKGPRDVLQFPGDYLPGQSPAMQAVHRELGSVADSDLPLLLVGETGVGKECLAWTVHRSSERRDGPFLPINCAAIPADLLEAELFGIAKGVATGVIGRPGHFVVAAGGSIFLDEIGDMSAALQAKLLRALEENVVQPVGGPPEQIDVRLIAATNTDLGSKVATGEFRRDLYYRLAGLVVTIPALRNRQQDVAALVEFFFHQVREDSGRHVTGLTYGAMRRLTERRWRGNVRELRHAVRRLVFLCPEGRAVDSSMVKGLESSPPSLSSQDLDGSNADFSSWESLNLDRVTNGLVKEAMKRSGGNQTSAAALLGISRSSFRRRLAKLVPGDAENPD